MQPGGNLVESPEGWCCSIFQELRMDENLFELATKLESLFINKIKSLRETNDEQTLTFLANCNRLDQVFLDAFTKDELNELDDFLSVLQNKIEDLIVLSIIKEKEKERLKNLSPEERRRKKHREESLKKIDRMLMKASLEDEAGIDYRRSNLKFKAVGIPIGAELVYAYDPTKICRVVDEKNKVEYEGKENTLSGLATQFRREAGSDPKGVQGAVHFLYEGETLSKRRKRMEAEERRSKKSSET